MNRWIQGYREGKFEYDELADLLSDYHKDVFGYRLRMAGEPVEAICSELARVDQYMEEMKATPEGRAQLEADGWSLDR